MTDNEKKAQEIRSKDPCQVWIGGCPNVYTAAMEMAKYDEDLAAFVAYFLPYDEDLEPCHITKKWVVEFGKKVVGNVFDNPELIKKEE